MLDAWCDMERPKLASLPRDLPRHPEIGLEEVRSAELGAERLGGSEASGGMGAAEGELWTGCAARMRPNGQDGALVFAPNPTRFGCKN
jgi:metal-dependent amidase/aminoacylase/carboxypeptidase family protein